MSFLVIANFKSNKTHSEVKSWLKGLGKIPVSTNLTVAVAPSFPHLSIFDIQSSIFSLAAQDVSPYPPGSYTGGVNATQLKDLGVKYCLVGHSERRRYFHETVTDVASKVKELLDVDITPVVCLSKDDIVPQHAALDESLISRCHFCFEPPNDIGGVVIDSIEDIKSTTFQIKKLYGINDVMYGGSVNAGNIDSLITLGLSGAIIATASLDPTNFSAILTKIAHAKI